MQPSAHTTPMPPCRPPTPPHHTTPGDHIRPANHVLIPMPTEPAPPHRPQPCSPHPQSIEYPNGLFDPTSSITPIPSPHWSHADGVRRSRLRIARTLWASFTHQPSRRSSPCLRKHPNSPLPPAGSTTFLLHGPPQRLSRRTSGQQTPHYGKASLTLCTRWERRTPIPGLNPLQRATLWPISDALEGLLSSRISTRT